MKLKLIESGYSSNLGFWELKKDDGGRYPKFYITYENKIERFGSLTEAYKFLERRK